MINLAVLEGTWRARRADIARLCEEGDALQGEERATNERQIIRLVDEVGHLHAMLKDIRAQQIHEERESNRVSEIAEKSLNTSR